MSEREILLEELIRLLAYCLWIEVTGRPYKNPHLPDEVLERVDNVGINYTEVEN